MDFMILIRYPLDLPDHYTYPLDISPHPVTHPPTHPYFPHFSLFTSHSLPLFFSLISYIFFFHFSLSLSLQSSLTTSFSHLHFHSPSSQYSVPPFSHSRSRSHWVLTVMDSQSTATLTRSFHWVFQVYSSEISPDLTRSCRIWWDLVRSSVILAGSSEISPDLGQFSPDQVLLQPNRSHLIFDLLILC